MSAPSFDALIKQLSSSPVVRRIYSIKMREETDPTSNNGRLLAIEAIEATPKQWQDLLDMVNASEFQPGFEVVRLEEASSGQRQEILEHGTVEYDQSDSPVSPT